MMPSVDQAIEYAIQAINQGQPAQGKAALAWVLQQQPYNGVAWLWMACCVTEEQAKSECYRRLSLVQGQAQHA